MVTAVDHSFTDKMRTKIDKKLNEVVKTVEWDGTSSWGQVQCSYCSLALFIYTLLKFALTGLLTGQNGASQGNSF